MTFFTETADVKSHFKNADKVLVFIALVLLSVGFLAPTQLTKSIAFTASALSGISIFLLASIFLASLAKATGLDQQISMVFSGHPLKAIIIASLFGALSPF